MGVSIGGLLVSSYSSYEAGQVNEDIAEYNQTIAGYQSRDAIDRGKEREKRFRDDASRLQGSQRAALAAQGIEIDDDSALDLLADTASSIEIDAITIRNNAAREAWGYAVQAQDYGFRGEVAAATGTSQAVSTILTSGSRLYRESDISIGG